MVPDPDYIQKSIQVLHIEDSSEYTALIKALLEKQAEADSPSFEVTAAPDMSEAKKLLSERAFDVILLDLSLPDGSGISMFKQFHVQFPGLPVVVVSADDDKSVARESVRAGAHDYLGKEDVTAASLVRVLVYAIERQSLYEKMQTYAQQFQASEARYRTVFEYSAAAITVTDANEHIVSWNSAAEELLEMSGDDLNGLEIHKLYTSQEWQRIRSYNLRQKGPRHHIEAKMLKKSGLEVEVEIAISVLKDSEGKVTGSIGIIRDISERKRFERLKDDFVSMVSHELRTPLFVIREGIAQIYDGLLGDVPESQKRFMEISLRNIDRLGRIVNDLLDVSRIEAGKMSLNKEIIDLADVADSVMVSFQGRAESRGVELVQAFEKQRFEIFADRDRVTQIFTNLIGNALKFTEDGSVEIRIQEKETHLECCVADTGPGIAAENLKFMFDKFRQFGQSVGTVEKGTGLGLSISKGIVELHHGRIWVESEEGDGSRFFFTLPKLGVNNGSIPQSQDREDHDRR